MNTDPSSASLLSARQLKDMKAFFSVAEMSGMLSVLMLDGSSQYSTRPARISIHASSSTLRYTALSGIRLKLLGFKLFKTYFIDSYAKFERLDCNNCKLISSAEIPKELTIE